MLNKADILKKYKKQYKPVFLLAWARFLTYDELIKTDNLEVLEKEQMLDKGAEWDKLVISYKHENIINALCIALDIAIKDITLHNGMCYLTYYDDILTWLKILENTDIQPVKKITKETVKKFYYTVSDAYKFDL